MVDKALVSVSDAVFARQNYWKYGDGNAIFIVWKWGHANTDEGCKRWRGEESWAPLSKMTCSPSHPANHKYISMCWPWLSWRGGSSCFFFVFNFSHPFFTFPIQFIYFSHPPIILAKPWWLLDFSIPRSVCSFFLAGPTFPAATKGFSLQFTADEGNSCERV